MFFLPFSSTLTCFYYYSFNHARLNLQCGRSLPRQSPKISTLTLAEPGCRSGPGVSLIEGIERKVACIGAHVSNISKASNNLSSYCKSRSRAKAFPDYKGSSLDVSRRFDRSKNSDVFAGNGGWFWRFQNELSRRYVCQGIEEWLWELDGEGTPG